MASVIIDPGHGGSDPGAVFGDRQEKDDALRLSKAVGNILASNGVNVSYTRTGDIYETPFQKAMDANDSGADFLISIHRNSSPEPDMYNGSQTLVFRDNGIRRELASNINRELAKTGFTDLGTDERPNLVVLKRSAMPAVLIEAGFINSEKDNRIFDENFDEVAQAIANGILKTIYNNGMGDEKAPIDIEKSNVSDRRDIYAMDEEPMDDRKLYRVQVGAFRNKENADRLLESLLKEGFPAYMLYEDGIYKVQVGAYEFLPNAIRMENNLRRRRYNTYITT